MLGFFPPPLLPSSFLPFLDEPPILPLSSSPSQVFISPLLQSAPLAAIFILLFLPFHLSRCQSECLHYERNLASLSLFPPNLTIFANGRVIDRHEKRERMRPAVFNPFHSFVRNGCVSRDRIIPIHKSSCFCINIVVSLDGQWKTYCNKH